MMNPAWCNPPPPGIDADGDAARHRSSTSHRGYYTSSLIDQIDPFIKNPEYVKYKRCRRTRSRSAERYRSREHRRRHRSRSRHRRHTPSRSRSRSASPARHRPKHKRRRSRSRSHERRKHDRRRNNDDAGEERSELPSKQQPQTSTEHVTLKIEPNEVENVEEEEEDDNDDDEDEVETKENAFKNDGSFMEMFKKMQAEEVEKKEQQESAGSSKKPLPMFGKRRGGRVLKTGLVEKSKVVEDDELANATDPWSIYLKEVKRYKEACCDDDSKTRPLVK